jgi:hypothetical protein
VETNRRRLRDAAWFETVPEDRELPRGDVFAYRVAPYVYLTSVVVFPLAFALAVVRPGGIPYWIWALLAGLVSVNIRTFVSEECGRQGRSEQGFFAFRAWSWLTLGGGIGQALRTIAANRRSMTVRCTGPADVRDAAVEAEPHPESPARS